VRRLLRGDVDDDLSVGSAVFDFGIGFADSLEAIAARVERGAIFPASARRFASRRIAP
jgi:hypothetical protein